MGVEHRCFWCLGLEDRKVEIIIIAALHDGWDLQHLAPMMCSGYACTEETRSSRDQIVRWGSRMRAKNAHCLFSCVRHGATGPEAAARCCVANCGVQARHGAARDSRPRMLYFEAGDKLPSPLPQSSPRASCCCLLLRTYMAAAAARNQIRGLCSLRCLIAERFRQGTAVCLC